MAKEKLLVTQEKQNHLDLYNKLKRYDWVRLVGLRIGC